MFQREGQHRRRDGRLSGPQRETLAALVDGPFAGRSTGSSTMASLARRGLVHFVRSGSKYGADAWYLTASGRARAAQEGGQHE